jgi:phosphatidylserine decarboxylase
MLSSFGKREWILILLVGGVLTLTCAVMFWWIAALVMALITAGGLAFFRDPYRTTPTLRGLAVSPADGRVSSIHQVERYEAFDGPAVCVRIFLSVLDVHINRSPLHGRVVSVQRTPGEHLNALKPESAEVNESVTIVLEHPTTRKPLCAVKQIAGTIARRIVCATTVDDILQRGQRYGMIKFGSTTELYLPDPERVQVQVKQGDRVYGGQTVIAKLPIVEVGAGG